MSDLRLFDLLNLYADAVDPAEAKVHLAVFNGRQNPLDVYFAGKFDEWQQAQSRKNFRRPLILSLIALDQRDLWLFAGLHRSMGVSGPNERGWYHYATERVLETEPLDGKLVVRFRRPSRQSYLNAERWSSSLAVHEVRPEPMRIARFRGYMNTNVSRSQLEAIVLQQDPSWRSALASVSGIYVITDVSNGRHYVGSATGEGGIWARWSAYAETGHGGNRELRRVLAEHGWSHVSQFQYAILETGDSRATTEEVLVRESYWKDVLATRTFGYNVN